MSMKAKFTGPSMTIRMLTKEDWARHGITMPTQSWNFENDKTVDITDWPEEAVALLREQPNFEIYEDSEVG